MLLQAVETQRLYQLVADQIEKMIHSGQIAPGSRLPSERDLATQLGVSRPSVREAMVALEIAGLIEIKTGSGIYVRNDFMPTDSSRRLVRDKSQEAGPFEILEARMLLEPPVAAEAAKHATAEEVERFKQILEEMRSTGDPQLFLEHDRRFHLLIAASTKNMTVAKIIDDLWSHNFTPMHSGMSTMTGLFNTEDMDFNDHSEIVRQIELGSGSGARRAMREHLQHVRAVLLKA